MERNELDQLLEGLVERLRDEGVPTGVWIQDAAAAREHLSAVDAFLRRLQEALTREVARQTNQL